MLTLFCMHCVPFNSAGLHDRWLPVFQILSGFLSIGKYCRDSNVLVMLMPVEGRREKGGGGGGERGV